MSRILTLAICGAAIARILSRVTASGARAHPRWARVNYRGRAVNLLEGPVCAVAATATAAAGARTPGLRTAALVAGVTAGAFGAYDDLSDVGGRAAVRGLRGHLGKLRDGTATGGLVKLAGIVAGGIAAGRCLHRSVLDATITGGLVAGSANLVNLLDLRPGRALKFALLAGGVLLPYDRGTLAGPLGVAAALLPGDLAERSMLGDTGANALGALLGLALATALTGGRSVGPRGRTRRVAALVAVAAVNLAGERISFTAVIERSPLLRRLDQLGRRPARRSVG